MKLKKINCSYQRNRYSGYAGGTPSSRYSSHGSGPHLQHSLSTQSHYHPLLTRNDSIDSS
ncbi:hypothetical protein AAVH_25534, partial [Aphelenchoides avenae]